MKLFENSIFLPCISIILSFQTDSSWFLSGDQNVVKANPQVQENPLETLSGDSTP